MGFSERTSKSGGEPIALERVKKLLSAGWRAVPEAENARQLRAVLRQLEISVVRFRSSDFAKEIQISDGGRREIFETHKAREGARRNEK